MGTTASLPGAIFAQLSSLVQPGTANCKDREMTCIAASGAASELQHSAFRSLAEVKAEIEEAKREREEKRADLVAER